MALLERVLDLQLNPIALRLAEGMPCTATPAQELRTFYKLPNDLVGIKTLDVCAGESDFTAWLAENGAIASAVDQAFDRQEYLHQRVIGHFAVRLLSKDAGLEDEIESHMNEVSEFENSESMKRFIQSRFREPWRYVQGFAHALPFADGTFDFVFSFHGVLGVTQENPVILKRSMDELIRVVRSGGQIQLGPMIRDDSQTDLGRHNQEDIIKLLRRRSDLMVSLEDVVFRGRQAQRLMIVKK